jgi:hypothetical protein
MSSGFCCAAKAPASNNVSPRISTALALVAIPGILCLSFFDLAFHRFLLIQMPDHASLVHLTIAGPYRID